MAHSAEYVLSRIDALKAENNPLASDRWRIRQIMNGGPDGIAAIMAWDKGKGSSGKISKKVNFGEDLPAVNMMASGVDRLAQKVGMPPTLRMPYGPRDSNPSREAAEKRERIVEGWDHLSRMDLTYPQIGRWLPGYGYVAWVIRPKLDPVTRQLWPHAEIRDPFDTWCGYYGTGQQPTEICFRRSVSLDTLTAVYPDYDWKGMRAKKVPTGAESRGIPGPGSVLQSRSLTNGGSNVVGGESGWAGPRGGTQVFEYYDPTGCYIVCPEFEVVCEYTPNICETGPMFVVAKRFSFDKLVSQYHHVIGLVAQLAKFNVLALMVTEEAAQSEINIFGEMEGNTYQRGAKGQNFLEANARVEKPGEKTNFPVLQQIDRLERQLRIGAAYDAGSDSIAARGGFITGRGQEELRDPIDANINEYQRVISRAVEDVDTRRLEWEEKFERSKKKRVFWIEGGKAGEETYVPKTDIAGMWRSKRAYGMMATWDDNSKIVAGIQLLQSGVIDRVTFQENLSGIDNLALVNQRVVKDRAESGLLAAMEQRAAMNDPTATMALVDLWKRPDQVETILTKLFTPQPPQPSPEEAAMMGGAQPGGEAPMEMGPGPTVQTVLSELEASGVTGGGVQTVNVNRR